MDDWYQCYMWIINYWNKKFGIKPKKIILTGDSSGGNIAIALTLLCIKKNIRKPDALILGYPIWCFSNKCFVPSLLRVLDDILINHKLLRYS